jgi:hypothetical protein
MNASNMLDTCESNGIFVSWPTGEENAGCFLLVQVKDKYFTCLNPEYFIKVIYLYVYILLKDGPV